MTQPDLRVRVGDFVSVDASREDVMYAKVTQIREDDRGEVTLHSIALV